MDTHHVAAAPVRVLTAFLVCITLVGLPPCSRGAEEDPAWWEEDLESRIAEVNEGELELLAEPPERPVHHHHNIVTLHPDSLRDGWAGLEQCHDNLDPVARSQVVYNAERIRNLRVVSSAGIGRARAEDAAVQLEEVTRGARLCVAAQSRVLWPGDEPDGYVVRNGPFMRRFLDGYYPMHVTMEVRFDAVPLRFVDSEPAPQPGLAIELDDGLVRLDAWFEGRLFTVLRFARTRQ